MTGFRSLVLAAAALGVVALHGPSASAHDLHATVRVSAESITVEGGYDDETPASEARVSVKDVAGAAIATGTLDDRGLWSFPRPAPGDYVVVVEIAGHRDRVKFEIPGPVDSGAAAAPPEAVTYSNWRLDKRLGLAIGLLVLLGGTLAYSFLRRRQNGRLPGQPQDAANVDLFQENP
jgi:hypothetical protein